MMRLDRNRPHGRVQPPYKGAHYTQGGYYFAADGRLVPGMGRAKAAATTPPQPEAELEGELGGEPEITEPEITDPEGRTEIDLNANWFTLRAQVGELTGIMPQNKDEAIALLKAEGLIPADTA